MLSGGHVLRLFVVLCFFFSVFFFFFLYLSKYGQYKEIRSISPGSKSHLVDVVHAHDPRSRFGMSLGSSSTAGSCLLVAVLGQGLDWELGVCGDGRGGDETRVLCVCVPALFMQLFSHYRHKNETSVPHPAEHRC